MDKGVPKCRCMFGLLMFTYRVRRLQWPTDTVQIETIHVDSTLSFFLFLLFILSSCHLSPIFFVVLKIKYWVLQETDFVDSIVKSRQKWIKAHMLSIQWVVAFCPVHWKSFTSEQNWTGHQINYDDMIYRMHKMQQKSKHSSLGLIQTVYWQQHCQRPFAPAIAVFNFRINRIIFYDPERQ